MLLAEGALRLGEARLSVDVRHLGSMPAIVAGLQAAPEPRVLILGNSQARAGLLPEQLAVYLSVEARRPVSVAALVPDAASIAEWRRLFDKELRLARAPRQAGHASSDGTPGGERTADWLILPFSRDRLSDGVEPRLEDLSRWHAARLADLVGDEVTDADDAVLVLGARATRLVGDRERVRQRVLSVLPGWPDVARRAMAARSGDGQGVARGARLTAARPGPGAASGQGETGTYRRLEALLAAARRRETRVIAVAMPTADGYALDPALRRVLSDGAGLLVDLRQAKGMRGHFTDADHLDATGGRALTEALGARLAPTFGSGKTEAPGQADKGDR